MIVHRAYRGVRQHFAIRVSEWVMLFPTFAMAIAFALDPDMFAVSRSYRTLERIADEQTWGVVVFAVGVARLAALTINGTFEGFRYTPHLRMGASVLGLVFWSQFGLGFLISAVRDDGAATAVVAYATFCLVELVNLYRAGVDAGRHHGDRRERGCDAAGGRDGD